jgi:hypothetical protein
MAASGGGLAASGGGLTASGGGLAASGGGLAASGGGLAASGGGISGGGSAAGGTASGGGTSIGGGASGGISDGGVSDGGTMVLCAKTPVECPDQVIAKLGLFRTISPGQITNTMNGTTFLSVVDSTAGGLNPTQAYVYAKFGVAGLEKVMIHDETALDSLDWDIAFRRFVIRLNGGDSGPSCTGAAVLPNGTIFDNVTTVTSGLNFLNDNFLDSPPMCTFLDDLSGLTTSPMTALRPYYNYTTCVGTTGRTFVVKTRAGKFVKLTVTTYYATQAGQTACNMNGATGGVPGGTMRVSWAYLN